MTDTDYTPKYEIRVTEDDGREVLVYDTGSEDHAVGQFPIERSRHEDRRVVLYKLTPMAILEAR